MDAIRFVVTLLCVVSVRSDTNYRLNPLVRPSSYEITLTPYFDTGDSLAFTFDGEVKIKVSTENANVSQIKLHSEDLIFGAENVTVTAGTNTIGLATIDPLVFDRNYTFVYINLATTLVASTEYTVTISYRGPIRSDLNGFYRSSYVENGITKWLGATQMEPVSARKAFPCFDEPEYKATFIMNIDRPETYKPSLANTKLQNTINLNNGFIRETFYPTPIMSVYLVAFAVSELETGGYYEVDGNHEFGVYVRPEATNQSEFAFNFGKSVVTALSNYLGIDYYSTDVNLKLDHVGLPDFRAGAMENWGLIKYREGLLLYVPTESTPYYKYRVGQIMAHETTHMWFGDLVTCHWWSNTWLNEGFATYFENFITEEVAPEMGSADILVTGTLYSAYTADEVPNSPPITNENVNSPAEVSGHFGTITYQKAGSVIRMMHHLIGEEAFRYGLNKHLEARKFDVAYPSDLYSALQQGVDLNSSLAAYPGATVADVMSSWVTQAGYPVLYAEVDFAALEVRLTQKRFYINSTFETNELYQIPITYTTEEIKDFNDTKPAFIMSNQSYTLSLPNLGHGWVVFNIQETGVYRVNYDSHAWTHIADGLKGEDRILIHHLNRAKIVNDLLAFVNADTIAFELAYEVLGFLANEMDYSVWVAAIKGLNTLRNRLLATDAIPVFDTYVLGLMENVIESLGYDERPDDEFVTLRNRMQVLEFACKLGHDGCVRQSLAKFEEFKEVGTPIAPSLRPVTYCVGLRYGDADNYDLLWNRMQNTNVANEALVIQSALGCTRVEEKLQSYLSTMMSDESPIRSQDITDPLTSILSDNLNAQFVFEFVKNNYEALNNKSVPMTTVLAALPAAMHSLEEFSQYGEWLSSCALCSSEALASARVALAQAQYSANWAREHENDIVAPIRQGNHAYLHTHSAWTMAIGIACVLLYNYV